METIIVTPKTIPPDANVSARTSVNVDWLMFGLYVVYIVVAFFVYELSSIGSPVCFSDCFEYIELMQASGPEFFHTMLTMFRPWAVPTFFSMFGAFEISSAARIVLSQTYIAFLSWLLFAYACQGMFATRAMKFVGFVAVSSLMFGQGYYHFNQFLLSELARDVVGFDAICAGFPVSPLRPFLRESRSRQNLRRSIFGRAFYCYRVRDGDPRTPISCWAYRGSPF